MYYAAAVSFVWGRLPYRDFLLLHPPGVMLALTPFALLGRLTRDHVGFETARVAWMLVGALNATLVFRICRSCGLSAATAGGLFYAAWTPVALTETTTRPEPLVSLGLLVAVMLLSREARSPSRRVLLWAGPALALSASVKIWAVTPGALVLLWVWRRAGAKTAGRTVLAGLAAGVLVDGPFLLAAPAHMFRMVVRDQLGRPRTPMDNAARLGHVLVPGITLSDQWLPVTASLVIGGCAVAVVCLACLGSGPGRFAFSLLGVQLLVLLLSPLVLQLLQRLRGSGPGTGHGAGGPLDPGPVRRGPDLASAGRHQTARHGGRGARHGTRAGPDGVPGRGLACGEHGPVPRVEAGAGRHGCSVCDLRLPRRSDPDRPVHAGPATRLPGAGRPQRSHL